MRIINLCRNIFDIIFTISAFFASLSKKYDGVEYMFIEGNAKDVIDFDATRFCEQSDMNDELIFRF